MLPADLQRVRSTSLFRDMDEDRFTTMMQASYLQDFPPRTVLIHEGQRMSFAYVLLDGYVELFAGLDSREAVMHVARPVRSFQLAPVLDDQAPPLSARTLKASRVLMMPARQVREVFQQDPGFARAITRELTTAFRIVVNEVKDQKLRFSIERLANWILQTCEELDCGDRFVMPYDKQTLASRLGTTPVNLSRTLTQIAQHGAEVRGREVVIRDPAALVALAKPFPSYG